MLTFTDTPVVSALEYPKDQPKTLLASEDVGPVALSDSSEGLNSYLWNLEYSSPNFLINRDGQTQTTLFSDSPVSEISLTFDQTANPFVAYEKSGGVYIYWFDPLIPGFTADNIASGVEPRCYLDVREGPTIATIIVAYRVGSECRYRLSSDRYMIEYTVPNFPISKLTGMAMGVNNRVIFVGDEG